MGEAEVGVVTTDYTVGDRDYWVAKARARGWAIHKLIKDNEKLEAKVKELEAQLKVITGGKT